MANSRAFQTAGGAKKNTLFARFGRRVRAIRERKNLTQEEFAHRIGMDPSYFGHVERGEKNISLLRVAEIAKGLGLSVASLFAAQRAPR